MARGWMIALAAFASALSLFAQSAQAWVYVYALRQGDSGLWHSIVIDGAPAVKLKRGTYFAVNLTPGQHIFAVQDGAPLIVTLSAAEDSFLRLGGIHQTGQPTISTLNAVHPDLARKEMLYLSYVAKNKITSKSVPGTDPLDPAEIQLKTREAPRPRLPLAPVK